MLNQTNYNPDVLNCLANLSSDEVFTPPNVVNRILDSLPTELWMNKELKVLDPVCKSGVFLREIAKRLMKGLQFEIPNDQERVNHILSNQLYGIAVTHITGLVTRRTLYCSKYANSVNSICTTFDTPEGNIFHYPLKHEWHNGTCKFCNAGQKVYDRSDDSESYAYNFIHPHKSLDFVLNQKYDLIIGGPPYQLYDGGGTGSSAKPVYHKFIQRAKFLNPRYLAMIIPARWYSGGKGLDEFRNEMLADNRIRKIYDYVDTRDCFPNVDIAGGICYFVWDRDNQGECEVTSLRNNIETNSVRKLNEFDTFIRDNTSIEIIKKIQRKTNDFMDSLVSSRMPFGLGSTVRPEKSGDLLLRASSGIGKFPSSKVNVGHELIDKWKVLLSKASNDHGGQADKDGKRKVFARIEIAEPKTICTESYLVIGTYKNQIEADNMVSFLRTKLCRFLVSTTLLTHNISKSKFCYVPLLKMDQNWSDENLYDYFELNEMEVDFIESTIREM
jgi:site-specific DNA-methyltransferase (adenine-specific)